VPPGPYLVAGCGVAGRAAARALVALTGPRGVAVWEDGRTPGAGALPRGIEVHRDADPAALVRRLRPRTLVKSPGIPPDADVVRAALAAGAQVVDELELGWRLVRRPVVAITGTNGKSTTAALVRAALGERCAPLAGNSEHGVALSALAGSSGGWVVCEVSSFQLEACPALRPDVAVMLNLTPDHLERHGTMAAYGAAKARLHLRGGVPAPVSVIDVEGPFGSALADACEDAGGRVVRVGAASGADYRLVGARWTLDGGLATIESPGGRVSLPSRLPGAHNARNLTAALAVADVLGLDPPAARAAMGAFPGVPGRFERIAEGQPFDVVVDFAHNPDGVERGLGAARGVVAGRRGARLVAVLSAAGARDPSGPPAMGRAAARLADELVLTTGASRGDPRPLAPLRGLASGAASVPCARAEVVPDRRAAIAEGIARARPGDVLVVAGRGARARLVVDRAGNGPEFDDRVVTRELLREAAARAGGAAWTAGPLCERMRA